MIRMIQSEAGNKLQPATANGPNVTLPTVAPSTSNIDSLNGQLKNFSTVAKLLIHESKTLLKPRVSVVKIILL